ncbi:ABC transporter substrate-binding protein [Paenibacillus sp. sgz500958]|uniref:ABC transporter substrate-binding protein n=1 Tax=Paenibacillus sp. sgz500958 TaxID=3242475 RepID=UPI0036D37D40
MRSMLQNTGLYGNKAIHRYAVRRLVPVIILCLSLLVAGCGSGALSTVSAPDNGTSSGKQPLRKLTLMLDWYPNAVHTFLYTAEANGYFAAQGLDVEFVMPADTNDALRLAAAGRVDLALSYQPQVLMARAEGVPVKALAAIVRHPLTHLMVPEDSDIERPRQLEGSDIGYSSIPLYDAIVRAMVKNDGGDPDKVKLVDVGYDLIPALATGQTDGIMGGFINHEALLLEKEGHLVRTLAPSDYGVPNYYELVLAASEDGISSSGSDFRKFMTAAAQGQEYVKEHPEEALEILLQHENETSPLDSGVEKRSLDILLPLMDAGSEPFGHQDPESWKNVRQWLSDNGLLDSDVAAEDAFVNL